MRAVPGLIAKDGFEGVQVAALPDGRAVAVKIADGADRARMPVTAAALARCGVDPRSRTPRPYADPRRREGGRRPACGGCVGSSPHRARPSDRSR